MRVANNIKPSYCEIFSILGAYKVLQNIYASTNYSLIFTYYCIILKESQQDKEFF